MADPAHAQDYDWNIPSQCIRSSYLVTSDEAGQPMLFDEDAPPEDSACVLDMVVSSGLHHGDVIRFGDFRDTNSYILNRQDDGSYIFIRNPDDTGNGYLSIPEQVLRNVTNAMSKYSQIINSDAGCINLHFSPRDDYIRGKLGESFPNEWKFNVSFSWGRLEHFCIATNSSEWISFDLETTSTERIMAYLEGTKLEQSQFLVKMDLKNEKYEEYKRKFGNDTDPMAWLLAVPEHPVTWRIEPGAMGMGSSYCRRDWICKGPAIHEQEVKEAIADFLDGFDYCIIQIP